MPCYRKTTKAGAVLEIEHIRSKRIGEAAFRGLNRGKTPEKQRIKNNFNAVKTLARNINANFGRRDLFLTLTFRGKEPEYDEAERLMRKFFRGVRTVRALRGMSELKYVAVIEDAKRIHIHVVMSGMSSDEIMDLWQHGKVILSRIEPNGEYTGLAHYITKEPRRPHKKRWSQSKNLKAPSVEIVEVSRAEVEDDVPTPKGYRKTYEQKTYIDDIGLYRYTKFVRYGSIDLSMGRMEITEADIE